MKAKDINERGRTVMRCDKLLTGWNNMTPDCQVGEVEVLSENKVDESYNWAGIQPNSGHKMIRLGGRSSGWSEVPGDKSNVIPVADYEIPGTLCQPDTLCSRLPKAKKLIMS